MSARSLWAAASASVLWLALSPAGAQAEGATALPPFTLETPRSIHGAPDFSLPDAAGRPLVLQKLRPRIVVINFWATWCVPCVAELPALQALAEALREEPFVLLPVDVMESVPRVSKFLQGAGLHLAALFDERGSVYRDYGVLGLPTTFVVDSEGRLIARAVGPRAWNAPESISYFRRLMPDPAHRN